MALFEPPFPLSQFAIFIAIIFKFAIHFSLGRSLLPIPSDFPLHLFLEPFCSFVSPFPLTPLDVAMYVVIYKASAVLCCV